MTYRELIGEIAALGFMPAPEDAHIAALSVRRALLGLSADYPTVRIARLTVKDGESGILDLPALIPDFRDLHGEITSGDGIAVPAVTVSGSTLVLPADFRTDLLIRYVKNPRLPDGNTPDEVLDVPREAEHLLALLAASYLWLDSDPEKAQYYMSLYRDGVSRLSLRVTHSYATPYRATGWDG